MQLDQNRERIDTTRLARELQEQRVDQEQKRYDVGMSTNFNVIQAQRDLAVARNGELQAQLDYQLALITFNTAQKIGTGIGLSTSPAVTTSSAITNLTSGATTGATTTTVAPIAPTGAGGPGGGGN
jgi:outer membrane protein